MIVIDSMHDFNLEELKGYPRMPKHAQGCPKGYLRIKESNISKDSKELDLYYNKYSSLLSEYFLQ